MLVLQFLTKNTTSSFLTRLISGVILVLLALLTIGSGGWVLFCTSLLLSLIGLVELYTAFNVRREKKPQLPELFGYIGTAVYYVCLAFFPERLAFFGILLALMILLFLYVIRFPAFDIHEIVLVFFGEVYVGVMLSCVWLLRMHNNGDRLVWLVFLAAWGSDTCAYCAGRLWGKRKLAPILSPKKTIEGALGGFVGAAVLGALYAGFTRGSIGLYVLICLAGAVISVIGDLAASAIKRQRGVKDYGTLIPGHGGILDRFDSVIFTAPVVYLLAVLLIR
ncbi:MAG: phosphatidate cytidylyltransferase [Eubacterium sp.]|nr:phosphatidate cytidylyltransferase [Eubacterium sp.]